MGVALLALAAAGLAWGQGGGSLIYSCYDAGGKRITRDRPIPECIAREQRVLNPDGSLNRVIPPTMTAEESALAEERSHATEVERVRQRDAQKRDQNLLARFPNEAAHNRAREQALEDVRKSLRTSEQRLSTLAKERKPLLDEAEFYVGKPLPLKLKLALDANDASVDAQRTLMQNQKLEIVRIDKNFDDELERLRRLWSDARPGSMGPL
ncbi:MAG: hypothetical protein M3O01_13435, partial [Pseudomonadota bacterium]|nr:hypothetical protein [Pseudomonadota bacterium]